jgi:hypothetical protein
MFVAGLGLVVGGAVLFSRPTRDVGDDPIAKWLDVGMTTHRKVATGMIGGGIGLLIWGGRGIGEPPSDLSVSARSVDFGTFTVGGSETRDFLIANRTDTPLTVSSVSAVGDGFSTAAGPSVPFLIPPGKRVALKVTCSPSSAKRYEGKLVIRSQNSQGRRQGDWIVPLTADVRRRQ